MTVRDVLRPIKRSLIAASRTLMINSPLPLGLQRWVTQRLLWADPWSKSLAYQQCIANRILRKYGPKCQSGPFKGMTCLEDANEGCLVPKLLGCYEEELIPTFESFFKRGFDRFIDVGCASGYWLTGVALRMPSAQCYGFDGAEAPRKRCSQLLALNGMQSRVQLFGLCTPGDFEKLVVGRTLVLMDVDGPEYELLDPATTPALRRADIIVECHDYLDPRIMPTLLARFESSHDIERISSWLRTPSLERYPGLQAVPRAHWDEALHERRPAVQDWLIMRVKG